MKLPILNSHSAAFRRFLDAMLERRGADGASIDAAVAKIIAAVRRRGDRALIVGQHSDVADDRCDTRA